MVVRLPPGDTSSHYQLVWFWRHSILFIKFLFPSTLVSQRPIGSTTNICMIFELVSCYIREFTRKLSSGEIKVITQILWSDKCTPQGNMSSHSYHCGLANIVMVLRPFDSIPTKIGAVYLDSRISETNRFTAMMQHLASHLADTDCCGPQDFESAFLGSTQQKRSGMLVLDTGGLIRQGGVYKWPCEWHIYPSWMNQTGLLITHYVDVRCRSIISWHLYAIDRWSLLTILPHYHPLSFFLHVIDTSSKYGDIPSSKEFCITRYWTLDTTVVYCLWLHPYACYCWISDCPRVHSKVTNCGFMWDTTILS